MQTITKRSLLALIVAASLSLPAFAANEPENVKNVSIKAKDATTLTLSWDAAKDGQGNAVDHYRIYYGTKSVQKSEAAQYEVEVDTPTNATTYDLNNLVTETTYYVSVTAVDKNKLESVEYSLEVSGTPSKNMVAPNNADQIAPTVLNVVAADKNHILIGFSEKVSLPTTAPESAFLIKEQLNSTKMLEVVSAQLYKDDSAGKTVLLETADQTANVNYVLTTGAGLKDAAGNSVQAGNSDSAIFLGSSIKSSSVLSKSLKSAADEKNGTSAEDLLLDTTTPTSNTTTTTAADQTAPEDVRNLMLSFKEQLEKFVVMMNWEASLNTAKDLVDQIVYMSTDLGTTFDTGRSVGPAATNYEVANLEGGKEYTFKVTTKDDKGNESVGVVKSIRLPQTGVGASFLILGSAYMAHTLLKRRRAKMMQNQ